MLNEYMSLNNDKIAYRIIDGEVVVVDLKDNTLNIFNPVATFIWEHIDGRTRVKEIIKKISDEFEIDYETAEKDCVDFFYKLKDMGIITSSSNIGEF